MTNWCNSLGEWCSKPWWAECFRSSLRPSCLARGCGLALWKAVPFGSRRLLKIAPLSISLAPLRRWSLAATSVVTGLARIYYLIFEAFFFLSFIRRCAGHNLHCRIYFPLVVWGAEVVRRARMVVLRRRQERTSIDHRWCIMVIFALRCQECALSIAWELVCYWKDFGTLRSFDGKGAYSPPFVLPSFVFLVTLGAPVHSVHQWERGKRSHWQRLCHNAHIT